MAFDLDIWQERTYESLRNIGHWLEARKNQDAPLLLYGYLSGLTLLPLALAAKSGDPMQLAIAVGGVFSGVGGSLLANKIQEWANQADPLTETGLARQVVAEVPHNPELGQEIDLVLQKLEVISQAQANLTESQQLWFNQRLTTELARLGNLPRFEAELSGRGAIAQGKKARAAYAERSSTAIAGDVQGDLTIIQGRPEADPASLREAYLNRLVEQAGYLSLTGIDPKAASSGLSEARLDLSAVYTALLTQSQEQPEELSQRLRPERAAQRLSALAQLDRHPRLVLLGDPGSGKSTFVDFVTICLAGELLGSPRHNLELLTAPLPAEEGQEQPERQSWRHGALLPVPVMLRDFAARGLPPPGQPATAQNLWQFFATDLRGAALGNFVRPLGEELHRQGGLLLLDGLDEVPEADQRRVQIKQAVEDFARTFQRCRILVTSRTYAYQKQDWRLPGFAEAVLAPFSQTQIRLFVERWYAHIATLRGLHPDDAQGRAELLKRAIFGSDRLRSLAERPLLLTLMASLHAWRGGSLPEKREELYADTVDLLLDWWESPKVVKDAHGQAVVLQPSLAEWLKVDREKVRGLLNDLAFQAHASQPELVGTADVSEGALVSGMLRLSQNPDVKPGRLVEYLSQRAGLLLPRGVGVYTFPHRTFQEYLAACHLTDADYPDLVAELARQEPNRWREVALLAGAKASRGATASLWQLAEALCFREPQQANCEVGDAWGALLAGQALVETADLSQVSERHRSKVERIRQWLVCIVGQRDLPALERARAGDILAHLGDPRAGVGLRTDGLPDIKWCEVPEGSFTMGSQDDKLNPWSELGVDIKETPQQQITLPAFRISRYPITNDQYQVFVDDEGYKTARYWQAAMAAGYWQDGQVKRRVYTSGRFEDEWGDRPYDFGQPFNLPNHPVVGVNWYEAVAFCAWLTERLRETGEVSAGTEISLPSESQWEKAARGRDGWVYPWGNEADPERANYNETGIGNTSAVGCFTDGASPYGVQDMSGNIWEWCRTKFEESYENYRDDNDLEGDALRVVRGGAFGYNRQGVRCAARLGGDPGYGDGSRGFRCVVSPFS